MNGAVPPRRDAGAPKGCPRPPPKRQSGSKTGRSAAKGGREHEPLRVKPIDGARDLSLNEAPPVDGVSQGYPPELKGRRDAVVISSGKGAPVGIMDDPRPVRPDVSDKSGDRRRRPVIDADGGRIDPKTVENRKSRRQGGQVFPAGWASLSARPDIRSPRGRSAARAIDSNPEARDVRRDLARQHAAASTARRHALT